MPRAWLPRAQRRRSIGSKESVRASRLRQWQGRRNPGSGRAWHTSAPRGWVLAWLGPRLAPEQFVDALEPVVEDAFNVTPDFQEMDYPPNNSQRQAVPQHVRHSGTAFMRLEAMGVMPEVEWSLQLHVHEAMRGIPPTYLGRPEDRNAAPAQPVSDSGAGRDSDRLGRENSKSEPGRRDLLEITGIREESEDLCGRPWNPLLSPERVEWCQRRCLRSEPRLQ